MSWRARPDFSDAVRMRHPALRRIRELDPDRDYEEIYRLHATIEFPWDIGRALELALYRTYSVPSIGGLLHETQEFEQRTQKRYDDTSLLLGEVLEHGLNSDRGRAAVRRINRIHARFRISNEDMLYVLSVFVVVPLRWLDHFGWRAVTDAERRATCRYYQELGQRMGIRDIPETCEEFFSYCDEFESRHFAYTHANACVGTATRELFVGWFSFLPAPLVRTACMRCSIRRCWPRSVSGSLPAWSSERLNWRCVHVHDSCHCCRRGDGRPTPTTPGRCVPTRAAMKSTSWGPPAAASRAPPSRIRP